MSDFASGAWLAFDTVLGWINQQEHQYIDKAHLYKAVMEMRPPIVLKVKPMITTHFHQSECGARYLTLDRANAVDLAAYIDHVVDHLNSSSAADQDFLDALERFVRDVNRFMDQ